MPKTAIAEDTVENVRNGNLNSCSFGFNVPSGGDKWSFTPDGAVLRTLNDVNLAEVSITSFAAYPATSVSLRSASPEIRALITRSNDDGCDCGCADCLDNDCENCTDEECTDEECKLNGCPAQSDADGDEDEEDGEDLDDFRSRMHMRLELAKRK
jgi:uncharacterized protein